MIAVQEKNRINEIAIWQAVSQHKKRFIALIVVFEIE